MPENENENNKNFKTISQPNLETTVLAHRTLSNIEINQVHIVNVRSSAFKSTSLLNK